MKKGNSCNVIAAAASVIDCSNNSHNRKLKRTHGLAIEEAPAYLTFNRYITAGYRNRLTPVDCLKSLFWWTNETLNIWSHLLGWAFFFSLSVSHLTGILTVPVTRPWDHTVIFLVHLSFQACMLLSAFYHVFCCCSEKSYRHWLSMDMFGISLSLLAIYISGIYYAFSCIPSWLNFHLTAVGGIFACCILSTFLLTSEEHFTIKLLLFSGWVVYGVIPTIHWTILNGGSESPAVALLLPRIFWIYVITGLAFSFYISRFPERLKPGLMNYIGSSHQIWHLLTIVLFYHWHNTGIMYLNYRAMHPCSEDYAKSKRVVNF